MRSLLFGLFLLSAGHLAAQDAPPSKAPLSKVNYPANFQVQQGINLFVKGDYLYWNAREDGLYYAQTSNDTVLGHIKRIQPRFGNGLRVGLGYDAPKEGYNIQAEWTWFTTHASNTAHGTLVPLWAEPDFHPFALASCAKGSWHLDLNLLDLSWGGAYWFGGNLSLEPFLGLRGAHIRQHLSTRLIYLTTDSDQSLLQAHSDFYGGGLRVGAKGYFTLPYHFALFGNASGSFLYGSFNTNAKTQEETTLVALTRDHLLQALPSLQVALGLSWDHHFAKDRLHIEFHLGWEQNLWFSLNKMNHYLNQFEQGYLFQESGNLGLQGLIAGGQFNF